VDAARVLRTGGIGIALVAVVRFAIVADSQHVSTAAQPRRMSFHNRLLLNRAVVAGLQTLEVMLLVGRDAVAQTTTLVQRLGGRVRRTDAAVGYLRVEVPASRLLDLVASADVEAYQISSLSKASWYRDGPPQLNARMHRGFETWAPDWAAQDSPHPDLPLLSPEAARHSGYTADDDVGIGDWMKSHPSFDGRGVTIALVENALPSFADPTLGMAKTLDGRDVPKIAGILNTIDPEAPDATRVTLDGEVRSVTSWSRIAGQTYILPRPGIYRFGLFLLPAGANLIHRFGVLRDEATHEIRVDTNGNADFQDETPVADVNERFDVRMLKLSHPRPIDLSFVMGKGRAPDTVHLYVGAGSHQTMTLSVAAGSQTKDGLAHGVAPGARILLVRSNTPEYRLVDLVEGFLEAYKRPDVDVFSDSSGIMTVPDTAADFTGLLFRRMASAYQKPLIHSASNMALLLNSAFAFGDGFSVGGSLGPAAFAAWYGGGRLAGLTVHPVGGAGPSLDGAIKPDFLAPMHRIAADLPWNNSRDALPMSAPVSRLPQGYQNSCCTSASSPYAAGFAALLISGARQQHVPYSLDSLGRAMRIGARFLPDVPSFQQGNGVLDVNAAWRELTHPAEVPRIVASADIVHPLAQYAANGQKGQGILEFEGWTSGMTGRRDIRLRRESGPDRPIAYRLGWTGNDGTFQVARSVTLPLNATIPVPVTIAVTSPGAHGAILNLYDLATGAVLFRTQATVVAAERIDAATGSVRMTGKLPLMRVQGHYVQVPSGAGAMRVELEVIRGSVSLEILPSHGLFPNYYQHVYPGAPRPFAKGRYTVVLPNPAAGVWTISASNDSSRRAANRAAASADEAEYAISVRLLSASLRPVAASDGTAAIDIENLGSEIREPALEASLGTLRSHRAEFLATGLPNTFAIDVPEGAATLALQLRRATTIGSALEMYLYDCTSGECFSYNLAFPAANAQTLVVRRPAAGRWVAAVNAAPFPTAPGGFVLDEIITTGAPRRPSVAARPQLPGARWSETLTVGAAPAVERGKARVLFFELIDLATERDEAARPWDDRPNVPKLRDRPAAIGTAVYQLK
jgi:hypothetical protein